MMSAAVPPAKQSIEAEQALIGAVLLNNAAYGAAVAHVSPDDFSEPLHAELFRESGRLIAAGRMATPIALKDAFAGVTVGTGPAALSISQYLARLCGEAPSVLCAADYARHVHELAMTREIIAIANDLEHAPAGQNTDVVLRRAIEQLNALQESAATPPASRLFAVCLPRPAIDPAARMALRAPLHPGRSEREHWRARPAQEHQ
jgi:replicative DNA helicase